MLLTLSTTHRPATDLGFLLHKNPARLQSFPLAFGQAHVFYPESSAERCTAALLLDVDPVSLVRERRGPAGSGRQLEQYVNDRPYVASSFLSVAIAQVYGSALAGKSKERQELADMALPFEAHIAAIPCRGGEGMLRRLFEPLGYEVRAERHALDAQFPDWGDGPYFSITLVANCRLGDLLSHLYVLVPVLDDDKHYWVGDDEVEKLLRHGDGWLSTHGDRDLIARRYLRHQRSLARDAIARLTEDVEPDSEATGAGDASPEDRLEQRVSLNVQRLEAVAAILKESGARRVLDLGCGEGRLVSLLLADAAFDEIVGVDVALRPLEIAAERLHLDRLPEAKRKRVQLLQGSLTYRDRRLEGYDAAAVVEVIEHLDPQRLAAFERVLFAFIRPKSIVLTTPNIEYNGKFDGLSAGSFRHRDHRFEWTRTEFLAWATGITQRFGFAARILPVGPEDPDLGPPTQMAVFERFEGGADDGKHN